MRTEMIGNNYASYFILLFYPLTKYGFLGIIMPYDL